MIFGKVINRYYLKYLFWYILGIAALVAVDFFQLRVNEIFGELIDHFDLGTLNNEVLVDSILSLLIVVLVLFCGRFLWRIFIIGSGVRVENDLRARMFDRCTILSQRFYQTNKVGTMMAYYTNDINTIRMSFGFGFMMLCDAIILGVLILVKMARLHLVLTLICFIPMLIIAIISGFIGKILKNRFKETQKSYADLSDFSQESFSGLYVVKAFVNEIRELRRFSKLSETNREKNLNFVLPSTLLNICIGALITTIIVIITSVGSYIALNPNVLSVGDFVVFITFFLALVWPMMAIANIIIMASQAGASLSRISSVFEEKVEIKDIENAITSNIEGSIKYNNLSFTYPDSDIEVLSNICINIDKGEHVGIIGKTGCGKTTIVDLLLRLYNLKENELLIDGIDIMKYSIKTVRDSIAYVPQDNFLFSDTIKNNIGFYSEKCEDELIKQASIMADLDVNVMEFKDTYETVLGERGVTISGGQKQRTSIARALIKDAPILVMDDALSAVDTDTEKKILVNLLNLRRNKTTILIAHRISTISYMKKIIVMNEGKVVAIGTHNKLLKECELYATMVKLQKLEDEVMGDL